MFNYFIETYLNFDNGLFFLLKDILFSTLTVLVFRQTDWKKAKSVGITLAHILCTYLVLTVIASLYYWAGIDFYQNFIPSAIVLIIYVTFFCRYPRYSKIIMAFAFFLFFYSSGNTGHIVVKTLAEAGIIEEASWRGELTYNSVAILLITGSTFFVYIFSVRKLNNPPKVFVITQIIYFAVIFLLPAVAEKGEPWQNLITNVGLMAIDGIAYYMFYSVTKANQQQMESKLILSQKEMLIEQIKISNQNLETLRKLRHEIRNQYTYLKVMIKDKQYEKLTSFFADMEEQTLKPFRRIECPNYTVAAIVNMEINKAEAYGVTIDTHISVPDVLPLTDIDLCSVITNMLDNAIEACVRLQTQNTPISFELYLWNTTLTAVVKNIVTEADNPDVASLNTTKSDKVLHGLGIKIVKEIAKKYDGYANFRVENGWFVASAILSLNFQ